MFTGQLLLPGSGLEVLCTSFSFRSPGKCAPVVSRHILLMGSLALKGGKVNCSTPQSWEGEKEFEMRAL